MKCLFKHILYIQYSMCCRLSCSCCIRQRKPLAERGGQPHSHSNTRRRELQCFHPYPHLVLPHALLPPLPWNTWSLSFVFFFNKWLIEHWKNWSRFSVPEYHAVIIILFLHPVNNHHPSQTTSSSNYLLKQYFDNNPKLCVFLQPLSSNDHIFNHILRSSINLLICLCVLKERVKLPDQLCALNSGQHERKIQWWSHM